MWTRRTAELVRKAEAAGARGKRTRGQDCVSPLAAAQPLLVLNLGS